MSKRTSLIGELPRGAGASSTGLELEGSVLLGDDDRGGFGFEASLDGARGEAKAGTHDTAVGTALYIGDRIRNALAGIRRPAPVLLEALHLPRDPRDR